MADIDLLRPRILAFEGGFQNMANDKANYTEDGTLIGTNKGVSAATYEKLFGEKPTVEDIKNLTDEQFDAVLASFGKAIKYEAIVNQSVADIWFDWAWASGPYYPNRHVQAIVGAKVDGAVGQHTIDAVNNFSDQEDLFNQIKQARLDYVDALVMQTPADKGFEVGWKSRINNYNYEDIG